MSSSIIANRIDVTLRSFGFLRKGCTWNRSAGGFVDVVHLQASKSGATVTLNVGVLSALVYAQCWEQDVPRFIDEASCTVRARIGQLIDGVDIWWNVESSESSGDIAVKCIERAIPFLDGMHSIGALVDFLEHAQIQKSRYPLPIIYLAILKHEQGNSSAACNILADLLQRNIGAWGSRAIRVATKIGCS